MKPNALNLLNRNRSVTPEITALNVRRWWVEREAEARAVMVQRAESPLAADTLVAVASQHPLLKGVYPGDEYRLRLDTTVRLWREAAERGERVQVAVFGSRHKDDRPEAMKAEAQGQPRPVDKVSLNDVAKAYLLVKGVPAEDIRDEWNQLYKGDEGIYNGGDEVLVASAGFHDNPNFKNFKFILSPGQWARTRLYCYANRVDPEFVPPDDIETVDSQFHGGLRMLIPKIITEFRDPTWQGEGSFLGKTARQNRRPEDGIDSQIPFEDLLEVYSSVYA